jgi:hypothetical protein
MRGRYRIFPANLAQTFDFGQEEDTYGEHVQCAAMSNKQIKEFRRDWSVKVPQEQQDEIELLVRILRENGLMSGRDCGGSSADEFDALLKDDDELFFEAPRDAYIAKLEKASRCSSDD